MDWEGTKQEKGETKDDDWKTSPLGTDLKMLVNNEKFSDVSFIVGDEKVKMFALKGILSARSKVFCRMFEGGFSEGSMRSIPIPDVDPGLFFKTLDYIYTGTLVFDVEDVVDLYAVADRYFIPSLMEECLQKMEHHLSPENVTILYEKAGDGNQEVLRERCFRFIMERAEEVFSTEQWKQTNLEDVLGIVRSEGLSVPEIYLLHAVLRWGGVIITRSDTTAECGHPLLSPASTTTSSSTFIIPHYPTSSPSSSTSSSPPSSASSSSGTVVITMGPTTTSSDIPPVPPRSASPPLMQQPSTSTTTTTTSSSSSSSTVLMSSSQPASPSTIPYSTNQGSTVFVSSEVSPEDLRKVLDEIRLPLIPPLFLRELGEPLCKAGYVSFEKLLEAYRFHADASLVGPLESARLRNTISPVLAPDGSVNVVRVPFQDFNVTPGKLFKRVSPAVDCLVGCQWQLTLKNKLNTQNLSLYVKCHVSKPIPFGHAWRVRDQGMKFGFINQFNRSKSIWKSWHKYGEVDNKPWRPNKTRYGFGFVMKLSALLDPQGGFIVNNCLLMEIRIPTLVSVEIVNE